MKAKKIKLGKVTQDDLLKNIKQVSREIFGFSPSKKYINKKKYNRKKLKKIDV